MCGIRRRKVNDVGSVTKKIIWGTKMKPVEVKEIFIG